VELFVVSILDGCDLIPEVDLQNGYKLKSYETTHFLQSLQQLNCALDFSQLLESIMLWLL